MVQQLLSLPLLLLPFLVAAETLTAKVIKISDGDTVHVLDAQHTEYKIRLSGIDAPENHQDFGSRAREYLGSLIHGKTVDIEYTKHDRYGCIVGKILDKEQGDVNLEMVRAGLAWWYRKYADEQSPVDRMLYEAAEVKAKYARRGLWVQSEPVPPWEWRHAKQ